MSIQLGKLVSLVLSEHFGDIVCKVGTDLFRFGSKTLPLIAMTSGLSSHHIKRSLAALIKYGLVVYEPKPNAEYSICTQNVIALLQYPKYILHTKNTLGTDAEMIVEELLQEGPLATSKIFLNIINKAKDDKDKSVSVVSLRDSFVALITSGYIHGVPVSENAAPDDAPVCIFKKFENAVNVIPNINIRALTLAINGDLSLLANDDYCWNVNLLRFQQDFRDELLITAMNRAVDECGGELMRHLLKVMYQINDPWVATSNMIPFIELKDSCRLSDRPLLNKYLEQYLSVLEEASNGIVVCSGGASGGQFTLKLARSAEVFVWDILFSTVQERLGTKAARIFRLIKLKKYIEEEDIQRNAMLPAKEAKQLTYRLLEEHFIEIQAVRKSTSANTGPTKAFYLYYIDLNKVANMLLETTYKALYNIISRRDHEKTLNKRMIEKQQRVDTIVHNLRLRGESEENIRDIEETVTPPEKLALSRITATIKKLSSAEISLFDTMFILQLYFIYKNKL